MSDSESLSDCPYPTPPATPDMPTAHGDPMHRPPDLKEKLQTVAASRGRQYAQYLAVLAYWEQDDTGAEQDIQTMNKLLTECFGFDQVIVTMISAREMLPRFAVETSVHETLLKHIDPNIPALLLFYYAGQAKTVDGRFFLTVNDKLIRWNLLQDFLFGDLGCDFMDNLDALAILDCCYNGPTVTFRDQSDKTTQILAASDDSTFQRKKGVLSLAQRIHSAAYSLRPYGPTVSTATLFQQILDETPVPKPSLMTASGLQPIVLTFKQKDIAKSQIPVPMKHINDMNVLVKLTISGEQTSDALKEFSDVIKGLPRAMAAEITDAYETDESVFCLLRMSWEAWALWSMATELQVVGTNIGSSLVHQRGLVEQDPFIGESKNVPSRAEK